MLRQLKFELFQRDAGFGYHGIPEQHLFHGRLQMFGKAHTIVLEILHVLLL